METRQQVADYIKKSLRSGVSPEPVRQNLKKGPHIAMGDSASAAELAMGTHEVKKGRR